MEPPNPPTEPRGSASLSRYQIQEELGRGAMGAVHKAFDPVIGRTVALKTILIDDHAPDRTQMIERLKQEAKAAGGLDHPNIITIYDVGEENGAVYLSMQFVQGTTLAKLLEVGVPSLPTLLSWADQILAAVGFAHTRGVIHRDLKPANLMVTEQGTIKVLDFGIAKVENTSLTQTGLVVGTPGYMAPEQIAGKKADHRADIFSLGAVFYELLTREKPFDGDIVTVLYKIVNEDPVAPSIINPAIPGGIDTVIRRALAKDPKDRFQTCEEMRKAFLEQSVRAPLATPAKTRADKIAADQPLTPVSARNLPQRQAPRTRIWPRLILASVFLLIAAAGWASYIRSNTGAYPPLAVKLVSQGDQVLISIAGKVREYSSQILRHGEDDHSVRAVRSEGTGTSDASATRPPNAATPAASSPAPVATLQPVSAQSTSDHTTSDNVSAAGLPASSSAADVSQRTIDSAQAASSPAVQPSDTHQPASDSETSHNLPPAPDASHQDDRDDKQTAAPPALKNKRKRDSESDSAVDGFSRQDVPDLLRQAESSAARGNYRLARYEYGLVLRLDHNNVQAREGLRRLQNELR